ncbi:MAG TPA: hypothetical protein VGB54_12805 [Allosphingosinicella sp.]|jgi:zona occludens toxin (predicted ATPase)
MLRTLLLVLALIVLLVAGLFYMGVLNWPGAGQPVEVRPVEVKMETRQVNVQVPVVSTNSAQPAAPPAVQPAPAPAPAQ